MNFHFAVWCALVCPSADAVANVDVHSQVLRIAFGINVFIHIQYIYTMLSRCSILNVRKGINPNDLQTHLLVVFFMFFLLFINKNNRATDNVTIQCKTYVRNNYKLV